MQEVVNNLDGTDYMKAESSEDIASLSQQDLNKLGKVKVMVNGKPQAYVVSDPAFSASSKLVEQALTTYIIYLN